MVCPNDRSLSSTLHHPSNLELPAGLHSLVIYKLYVLAGSTSGGTNGGRCFYTAIFVPDVLPAST
eukprot:399422-Pyramimonas_sp.AAC.1